MRISPIQSRISRRDENFLTLNLELRDEIKKEKFSFNLRPRDEIEIYHIHSQASRTRKPVTESDPVLVGLQDILLL